MFQRHLLRIHQNFARVARFAARFAVLGFEVAPETLGLDAEDLASGEVDALVPERVWKEWERALTEYAPGCVFFSARSLWSVLTDSSLQRCVRVCLPFAGRLSVLIDPVIRFAVVLHRSSQKERKELVQRYRVPMKYQALAQLVAEYGHQYETVVSGCCLLLQSLHCLKRWMHSGVQNVLHTGWLPVRLLYDKKESGWLASCLVAARSVNINKL